MSTNEQEIYHQGQWYKHYNRYIIDYPFPLWLELVIWIRNRALNPLWLQSRQLFFADIIQHNSTTMSSFDYLLFWQFNGSLTLGDIILICEHSLNSIINMIKIIIHSIKIRSKKEQFFTPHQKNHILLVSNNYIYTWIMRMTQTF